MTAADKYREDLQQELYFLNYLDDVYEGMTHEESMKLLTEELERIT